MWQKGKDFLVKIALVISPLEATQRRTDFVCRTCRRRCAKRRLRRLLAAADHASGLPRATTPLVDPRLGYDGSILWVWPHMALGDLILIDTDHENC